MWYILYKALGFCQTNNHFLFLLFDVFYAHLTMLFACSSKSEFLLNGLMVALYHQIKRIKTQELWKFYKHKKTHCLTRQ